MSPRQKENFHLWDFSDDDGRQVIREWSHVRHTKMQGLRKKYYNKFLLYTFNMHTCKSFIANFNFMVILQMLLAALSVYVFRYLDISFDFHVSLFVSPIVFPLAFSINTDFQRREKVLEDLANFKSSAMLWFFCMREWKTAARLDDDWLAAVHMKLKNMMFNLREYLLTDKIERREFIARCLYEDFSDANQLIERVRASDLPTNTAIISRAIHLLNMLCLSFERLRVIREYRSPRAIRSLNKVLILFLPMILSPYFVFLSKKEDTSQWSPYYIAVLVAAVFGALQGVQDKLDDPFDGMSEDDIKLQTIDDWTFNNLEVVKNRNFTVGRFHVSANIDDETAEQDKTDHMLAVPVHLPGESGGGGASSGGGLFTGKLFKKNSRKKKRDDSVRRTMSVSSARHQPSYEHEHEHFDPQNHPYADVLQNIKGNARVQALKKTGKVLVTDNTITRDFDKQKAGSSYDESESGNSSPEEPNRLINIFKPHSASVIEKGNIHQSEASADASEPMKTSVDLRHLQKSKEVKFSMSPTRSVSPDDSLLNDDSILSSPSRQPLIKETPPPKTTAPSRFKLNCVPPPKIESTDMSEIIENNNTDNHEKAHEYNGDSSYNGDNKPLDIDLEEIVIINNEANDRIGIGDSKI